MLSDKEGLRRITGVSPSLIFLKLQPLTQAAGTKQRGGTQGLRGRQRQREPRLLHTEWLDPALIVPATYDCLIKRESYIPLFIR